MGVTGCLSFAVGVAIAAPRSMVVQGGISVLKINMQQNGFHAGGNHFKHLQTCFLGNVQYLC